MESSLLGSNPVSNMQSNSNVKTPNAGLHSCDYELTFDIYEFERTPVESPQFSAENNSSVKWSFATELLKYEMTDDFDDVSLQLKATTINRNEAEQHYQYGGEVTFCLRSNIRKITCKREFTYNEADVDLWRTNEEKSVCFLYLSNVGHGSLSFEKDRNFKLKCEIRFIKLNDIIPLYTSLVPVNTAPLEPYPLEDYEKLYLSDDHSDVTICIKIDDNIKEYPAHKNILSVRSKVFEAMFRHDMIENKLDRVVVEDIKEEVFLEILRYIYANKVQNLDTLVYELLPVADRYALERLKIICGRFLMKNLSEETVLRILKLADTYNVDELKFTSMQFIRNCPNFFRNMESNAWKDLLSRPQLMKDILIQINTDDELLFL